MTKEDFAALVELVLTSKRRPPDVLFAGGFDDWHARARLGHFLAMQEVGRSQEARELFVSILAEEVDEGNSEDIEEKAFALQRLSEMPSAASSSSRRITCTWRSPKWKFLQNMKKHWKRRSPPRTRTPLGY